MTDNTLEELAAKGVPVNLQVGDRMKVYESLTEQRLDPTRPIIARADGRGFSRLTRGMQKPDERFNRAMMETTQFIVEQTHASLGYTQSDEISIVFLPHAADATVLFDGRVQKLASVIASMASVAFNAALMKSEDLCHYADRMPIFDCRVYQTPTEGEAANALLWRVRDATKNATSMVAGSRFSHKQLHGKSSAERRDMLKENGVDFFADFPSSFRNGSFWKREVIEVIMTEEERLAIPEKHRLAAGEPVYRSRVQRVDMPDQVSFNDIAGALIS